MSIRSVWLKARAGDPAAAGWAKKIYDFLAARGVEVYVDPVLGHEIPVEQLSENEATKADLGILVGGDGTFLRIVQKSGGILPPILGFAADSLGYLLPHSIRDAEKVLENVLEGNYSTRNVALGEYTYGDEKGIFLNELCIWALPGKLIEFEFSLDGLGLYHGRSDGIIVATPSGSTGHALSYGGPVILDVGQKLLEVLFPGALSPALRPLVIHGGTIGVRILAHPANMILDGQKTVSLGYSAEVRISNSERMLRILFVKEFEVKINEKLKKRVSDRNFSYIM